jgi:hypothetical protein
MTPTLKRVGPPLCPVLLAVFPALSLFAQNQTEVELSVLWLPIVLSAAGALLLFGLFLLITKGWAGAGVLASVVVVAFLYQGLFFDQRSAWLLVPWLGLFVVAAVAVLRTERDVGNLTLIVGVAALVVTVPPSVSIARYHASHHLVSAADARLWPTNLVTPVVPAGSRPPDIYVIIPDDYERTDVLQQYFHFDDSQFVAGLEQRGFTLSDQARSPYSDSESNIAALLNMDYLSNFPRVLGPDSKDVRLVKRVSEDNRAARLLRSIGYDYVHLDTDEVTFAGGNPAISPLAPPDSFMNLWMRKTVLRHVGGPLGFDQAATDARFRTSIRSQLADLSSIQAGTRPKFVVFHTLLPHDPYVYGARGEHVTYPVHADLDLSSAAGRARYVQQLQFTGRQVLGSIDQILAHATTPPVIVLQADEGFSAEPDVFGEAAMRDIRVKGLSAFRLPGHQTAGVPMPPSSVNALRFVFNQYLGTHYEMLPSASYAEGDLPYDFTQRIQVR